MTPLNKVNWSERCIGDTYDFPSSSRNKSIKVGLKNDKQSFFENTQVKEFIIHTNHDRIFIFSNIVLTCLELEHSNIFLSLVKRIGWYFVSNVRLDPIHFVEEVYPMHFERLISNIERLLTLVLQSAESHTIFDPKDAEMIIFSIQFKPY